MMIFGRSRSGLAADAMAIAQAMAAQRASQSTGPTPGVLIDELFSSDGPHGEYADQWVRVPTLTVGRVA